MAAFVSSRTLLGCVWRGIVLRTPWQSSQVRSLIAAKVEAAATMARLSVLCKCCCCCCCCQCLSASVHYHHHCPYSGVYPEAHITINRPSSSPPYCYLACRTWPLHNFTLFYHTKDLRPGVYRMYFNCGPAPALYILVYRFAEVSSDSARRIPSPFPSPLTFI